MNFKRFQPRIDIKRRLVLRRFYTGVNGSNSFCYRIERITKKGLLDKRFKSLFAYGADDFKTIKNFKHTLNGKAIKVFKTSFVSVFKIKNKSSVDIWDFHKNNKK